MTQLAIPQHVILGTGQLGLAIMDELVAQGLPVRLVNRRGHAPRTFAPLCGNRGWRRYQSSRCGPALYRG